MDEVCSRRGRNRSPSQWALRKHAQHCSRGQHYLYYTRQQIKLLFITERDIISYSRAVHYTNILESYPEQKFASASVPMDIEPQWTIIFHSIVPKLVMSGSLLLKFLKSIFSIVISNFLYPAQGISHVMSLRIFFSFYCFCRGYFF